MSLSLFAPAKVNLFLHVISRRSDGYHELESLIVFVDVGDRLSIVPGGAFDVVIDGPFADTLADEPVSDNLVHRAGRLLMARSGHARVDGVGGSGSKTAALPGGVLRLEKNLPVAAGLGGGSADAAAALRLLKDHWSISLPEKDLHEMGLSLGADIPVCLESRPAFVTGIGETIEPAPALPEIWAVLVNSGTPVPTGKVFKGLDPERLAGKPGPGVAPEAFRETGDLVKALAHTRNDLEASALKVAPDIADVLALIARQSGCALARMSGSGGTCFGLFPTQTEALAAVEGITQTQPGWWAKAGRILNGAPQITKTA